MSLGTDARRLLRRCRSGSLGTVSRRLPGYPYVSIVPFMLDHDKLRASKVVMTGVDCDGFDVRADEQLMRFEFPETVRDAQSVRSALAELARESRS